MKKITKTIYKSDGDMYDTPAAVDRETGTMYINPKLYFSLTPFQRKFVKLHELGHLYLDTNSELDADNYAFDKLAGTEFRSLKQCIECLETILDPNKTGHAIRIENMYQRALDWDKNHPLLDKASSKAEDTQAETQQIAAILEGVNNNAQINANRETDTIQTKYLTIGLIAIAAIMLLK